MVMRVRDMFRDESGAALVIALMMMIVLTLIGLASIYASTFELKLSGNKRGSTEAFYAAENGVQTVVANIENFNLSKYDPATNAYEPTSDPKNPNPAKAKVIIEHDTTREGPPRGSGFSATNFEFERFLIRSTGQDQTEISLTKSTCNVEEKVVRLVPTLQGGY
jgi:Tfp pilus assembly protein PilX